MLATLYVRNLKSDDGGFLTLLVFRFYPQNHSVARADYMSPCIPYELTGAGRVGFWSGFEPINVVLSNVSFLAASAHSS